MKGGEREMIDIVKPSEHNFNAEVFWNNVALSVPGISIANKENLQGNNIQVLFTFCPLYQQGALQNSELLASPSGITESRVAGKWDALQKVVSTMQTAIGNTGVLEVTVVFANRGVLLNHMPTEADEEALTYHEELYRQAVTQFFSGKGVAAKFLTYNSTETRVHFPKFVNPNDDIPNLSRFEDTARRNILDADDPNTMIELLNHYMKGFGLESAIPVVNKKVRQTLKDLIKAFGSKTAFWLVAGYLAFDGKISELVGENGVYMATERFAPLFKIARLTPSLYNMTRVEIPA